MKTIAKLMALCLLLGSLSFAQGGVPAGKTGDTKKTAASKGKDKNHGKVVSKGGDKDKGKRTATSTSKGKGKTIETSKGKGKGASTSKGKGKGTATTKKGGDDKGGKK
ncbi:MAG: hypothetical protein ACHP79_00385 [Terriglobales bacterium]